MPTHLRMSLPGKYLGESVSSIAAAVTRVVVKDTAALCRHGDNAAQMAFLHQSAHTGYHEPGMSIAKFGLLQTTLPRAVPQQLVAIQVSAFS